MKRLFILIALFVSFTSYSQADLVSQKKIDFGFYWVSNFPQAPYGAGYNIAKTAKKLGFYNNYTFGNSSSGSDVVAHENTGIYQVGSWGNNLTGRTNTFELSNIFCVTAGVTYKYYNGEKIKARLYSGVGLANYSSTKYISVEAEDVTSGYNVLGYYWLDSSVKTRKYNEASFSIGTFLSVKYFLIGLGYETSPSGVQLSIGFNF